MAAGMRPDRIVFSGVGKTDGRSRRASAAGVRAIHVESAAEIDAIEAIAQRIGRPRADHAARQSGRRPRDAPVHRDRPARDASSASTIDAARALLPRILESQHLAARGGRLPHRLADRRGRRRAGSAESLARFAVECQAGGRAACGPSTPAAAGPSPTATKSARLTRHVAFGDGDPRGAGAGAAQTPKGLELIVEPGRAIVGDAGVLLTQRRLRQGARRQALRHRRRRDDRAAPPRLYNAYHAIMPVPASPPNAALTPADVVGPVCETGDFFAHRSTATPADKRRTFGRCAARAPTPPAWPAPTTVVRAPPRCSSTEMCTT